MEFVECRIHVSYGVQTVLVGVAFATEKYMLASKSQCLHTLIQYASMNVPAILMVLILEHCLQEQASSHKQSKVTWHRQEIDLRLLSVTFFPRNLILKRVHRFLYYLPYIYVSATLLGNSTRFAPLFLFNLSLCESTWLKPIHHTDIYSLPVCLYTQWDITTIIMHFFVPFSTFFC